MPPPLVPPFPLLGEPGAWDALTLLAATVFLEAQDEPFDGLLGVAWVIRRRALDWNQGWHGAVLGRDARMADDARPFEPFSCWNDTDAPRSRARLITALPAQAEPSWRVAAAVLWHLLPDPVAGAAFYLNIEVTRKIRGGSLPAWYDEGKVTAVLGRHTFLLA